MNFYQQDNARKQTEFEAQLNAPIFKQTQTALTDEAIAKFKEAGILARPISATEYLLVYPNGSTIIMKGRS